MTWELERHPWGGGRMCADASELPSAISRLVHAQTESEASAARHDVFERSVIHLRDVFEPAPAVVACLCQSLGAATWASRPLVLDLLASLAGGDDAPEHEGVVAACRRQLLGSFGAFCSLLEQGHTVEIASVVDLVALCGQEAPGFRAQARWYLQRAASREKDRDRAAPVVALIDRYLADLREDAGGT